MNKTFNYGTDICQLAFAWILLREKLRGVIGRGRTC